VGFTPKALFFAICRGAIMGSMPNEKDMMLKWFEKYLEDKVSPEVKYEYIRFVKKFLEGIKGNIDFSPALGFK